MPAIVDPSAAGPITRETLFQLMVLARDTSFLDAQIRAICDTITQENANDSIELLRRLHASQETSLVLASAAVQRRPRQVAAPRNVLPLHSEFSEVSSRSRMSAEAHLLGYTVQTGSVLQLLP
ncbi:hypothetical protein KCU67_g11359, partial [Aureobasidium melanogenum]